MQRNNIINDWLDQHGDLEITKLVSETIIKINDMRKFNNYDSLAAYGEKVGRTIDWEETESPDPKVICGEELQSLSNIISLAVAEEVLRNTAQVNGTFICGSHSDRLMDIRLRLTSDHNEEFTDYVNWYD